ncbi:hypothetical protein K2Z83_09860 [Oscillochloris sp. ZM17-4]|uniref:hypothetical protein n=1 Tax=Oscillochloris sp. ZM17-4 TaxID=2866714 RepID=UPI001C73C3BB|nr:hypothetical protein [Oscillochloris sp. ZM17-4]MBX0327979.1 hypothetical protein [Oscillochloris sp. ZM17-4]
MTRSASKQSLPQSHSQGASLAGLRIGDLRPYMLLALLTILVITAAYAVRPVVRIDMGGDYDSAFLQGFNAREIDADGASETFPWAAGQETLTVPGYRRGVWIATLRAAPGQPPDILREAAVAVNDVRVDMPRRTADTLLASIPPELSAAPSLSFSLVSPLVGGALPPKDIVAEIVFAPARTYRWSTGESSIVLPGIGRGAWTVDMGMVTSHPNGQPVDARILANGRLLASLPDNPAPRRVHILVPPDALSDGSLSLDIRANVYSDPRPLGVFISGVTVAPAGAGVLLPPLAGLGQALVVVLGMYASLMLALGERPRPAGWRGPTPLVWSAFGVAAALLIGGWALGTHRFPSSFMLPRLAWLSAWSILLTLAARPITVWLFRMARVPAEPRSGFVSLLLAVFLIGYWLKAAGMLYPYFTAIDVHWHMDRVRWILQGQLPMLYGVNSPLNESTMPTAEWGANRPVIPYSPWYHIFATLFALTPMSMELAANMFSLLLDASRVILIALIARKAGLSQRGALIAAITYAALPVGFLLHIWGNVPTAFGLWLTLLSHALILALWDRLGERGPMVAISAVLLATFLIYTVTGVFMGVFLVALTALVWLNGVRGGRWAELRAGLRPLWAAAGVAIALALIIYYGQYIPPIIERTVPYMQTVFTKGPESVGVERPPFSAYMLGFIPHLDYRIWPGDYLFYGIGIPMLFTVPGFIALRRRPLAWIVFATWMSVAVLFMLAGYRISMVDKQIFYMLPVMCVCWAVYADRIWQRGRWGQAVIIAILALSLATALGQWVMRISISPVSG